MTTSAAGRKLIETFEGLRLTAYLDQNNIPTIGYGHTSGVYLGQTITQEEADEFLAIDLHQAEQVVYHLADVPLNQNQFDALVSLIYNIGGGAFKTSTVLRRLLAGDYEGASAAFLLWDKVSGQTNQGLLNRRTAERILFLTEPT